MTNRTPQQMLNRISPERRVATLLKRADVMASYGWGPEVSLNARRQALKLRKSS